MIYSFLTSLPYIACLIWAVYFACMNGRSREQKTFLELICLAALFEFAQANLMSGDHSHVTLIALFLTREFTSLLGLTVMNTLLFRLEDKKDPRRFSQTMFVLSLIIVISTSTVLVIAGADEGSMLIKGTASTDSEYYQAFFSSGVLCYYILYGILLGFNIVHILSYLLRNRKGIVDSATRNLPLKAIDLLFIVSIIYLVSTFAQIVLVNRPIGHPGFVSSILSVIDALCVLAAGYSIRRWGGSYFQFILHDMLSDSQVPASTQKSPSTPPPGPETTNNTDGSDNGPEISTELLHKFERYMKEKKPYLHSDYSMETAAEQLNTNRTYISILVNKAYKKNFREFINEKRIDEAKRVMKASPDAILEEVAASSGFNNASQLTRKFKELTGMTPRQWQKSQE